MKQACACVLLLAALCLVVDSGSAEADGYWGNQGGCGAGGHGGGRFTSSRWNGGGGCGCAYGRRYGYGGNWSTLRRYLTPTGAALRYVYVRRYFMRRYPQLFPRHHYSEVLPEEGAEITYDHYLHPDYDVAAHPLTETQQLHLGQWKYFLADYEGARESFDAVLAANPDRGEARYGRLFCSIGARDWKTAATDMAAVAKAKDLRIDDGIAEGIFGDNKTLGQVIADLRETTRWSFGDGNAHLVSAWLHTTQGNLGLAEVHLKKAERLVPDNTATQTMRALLDGDAAEPTPAPEEESAPDEQLPIEPTIPQPAPDQGPAVAVKTTKAKSKTVLVATR